MLANEIRFCLRLAKALAVQFGPNCEIVVHDLGSNEPEHSIVAIENGHVSGRKVGGGPSQVVLEALRSDTRKLQDRLAYLTRTEDGRILKSSTIYMRDEDGRAIGIFSINYDISAMKAMEEMIHGFVSTASQETEAPAITHSVGELLEQLIEQSVAMVGKPAALMTKDDKVRAIRFLNDSGAFLITKSGQRVCSYFGISKYTLYSYLDEAKAADQAEKAEQA